MVTMQKGIREELMGAPRVGRKDGTVSMCWEDNQRHTLPKGMEKETFMKEHTKYYAYYLINKDEIIHYHQGSGRPFATCCLGCRKEFGNEPIHVGVGVPEDLRPGGTPVLGWCACITCLECVYKMPLEYGLWRRCRGCWSAYGHQNDYLMYPVTVQGIVANNNKAKKLTALIRSEAGA
jgi:hypothetical protein